LCSWPKGGKLALPFVYSDEVWTGIEYQVASHLMLMGKVEEGLEIVRRLPRPLRWAYANPSTSTSAVIGMPGRWQAMGLLQGLTGVRYDAVDKNTLYRFKSGRLHQFHFYGQGIWNVALKRGVPFIKVVYGGIPVERFW